MFQSAQVGLAIGARGDLASALAGMISDLIYTLSVIAYVPTAMMLAAVAVVSSQTRAFLAWLGWLSAVIVAAGLFMSLGIVVASGPCCPLAG